MERLAGLPRTPALQQPTSWPGHQQLPRLTNVPDEREERRLEGEEIRSTRPL